MNKPKVNDHNFVKYSLIFSIIRISNKLMNESMLASTSGLKLLARNSSRSSGNKIFKTCFFII